MADNPLDQIDWSKEDFEVGKYAPDTTLARRAGLAAQSANPDESAKAFDIAPKVGLPPSITQYNVPAFQTQVQQQQNNALTDANPQLAKFVSDPAVAAAVKDDYGPLAQLSAALNPGGPTDLSETDMIGDSVLAKTIQSGYSHQNYARLATAYQAGAAGLEPKLREYETEFQKEQRYTGFDKYVAALGGFVGSSASSAQVGALGAVAGAPLGPAGVVGGFGAGFIGDMFATTSGQTYRRLDLVRDDNGQAIPEGIKQAAALSAGSIGMMAGIVGGGITGKIAGNLIGDGIAMGLSRAGVADAITAGVGGTLKAGITGGAVNAGIALSAELTPILAQKFSGLDFNDPNQWQRVREETADAFVNGAFLFGGWHGVTHLVPVGMNWLQDRATIQQAQLEGQQRLSIVGAMQVSKTAERSQELIRQYLEQHNFPDIHVSAEAVAANRKAFDYVPDIDQQLAAAGPVGGDVSIPAADYFTKTDPKLQNKLNEEIRGPSGLSLKDADELEKNPPDYATVFHGSPHSFESFDINKIGTGEGAQAYGHGLYFAERRGIAEGYRDTLSNREDVKVVLEGKPIKGHEVDELPNEQQTGIGAYTRAGYDIDRARKQLEQDVESGSSFNKMWSDEDIKNRLGVFGEDNSPEAVAAERAKLIEEEKADIERDKAGLKWLNENADKLEKPNLEGHLYQAKIMRPKEHFLDWDAPLEEQSPYVQEALRKLGYESPPATSGEVEGAGPFQNIPHAPALGADIHDWLAKNKTENLAGFADEGAAAASMSDAGIAGIKYADAASRTAPAAIASLEDRIKGLQASIKETEGRLETTEHKDVVQESLTNLNQMLERAEKDLTEAKNPTRNYVVFNDKDVLITHKNDVALQIEAALERTTEQIEASMGLRKATETSEGKPLWLDPLIEAKGAGVPKQTFAQLSRHIQEMQRKITQAAFDSAEKEMKRRETPLWKANLAEETEQARTEMEQRPDFKAWHGLVEVPKDDPFSVKLNRNETDALFNRESPSDYAAFQKDGTRASESLPKNMFDAKSDVTPDQAAEMFGFNSGKDMLAMLRQHEANIRESGLSPGKYFDGLYAAEGRRRMEQKYGDLQMNIMKEALATALDVKQIDVLGKEIELLGGEKITKQKVLDKAREITADYRADEMNSKFFMKEAGKYGEAAFRASVAGKYPEALENKHRQLISFTMAREAKAFEAQRDQLETLMDRAGKNVVVKGVDQRFTNRMHEVMALVGEKVPRTADNLRESLVDRKGNPQTFKEFVDDLKGNYGLIVPVANLLETGGKPYKEMRVGEVRQLRDTLNSLDAHGRNINSVIVNGQKQALENFLGDILLPHLDSQEKPLNLDTRTIGGQITKGGRTIDSAMLRAQQLFEWLDKGDPLGPMTTTVYRRLKKGEFEFLDGHAAFAKDWNENVTIDKAWRKTLNDKTKNTILADEDDKAMTLYRDHMIAMALNVGNEWNMRVLTAGRRWHPEDVMQYLHENMTAKDWEFVQSIWDRFEKIWPQVRDASEKRTGVAVEKIPAREFDTPHGTVKGGYYPLIEEPASAKTRREKAFGIDQSQPFRTLSAISNATNARTGAVYPIDLSLDRLPYVIRETLHEIHMGPALTETAKIILDPLVLKGISKAMGPEYADSIKPWFSYIASDGGATDPSALGWLTSGSRYLRQSTVTQLVGYRASTGFIHGLSAAANSWTELVRSDIKDHAYMREALSLMTRDPATGERYAKQFADESGELRNRFHNMERDMGAIVMRDLKAPAGLMKVFGDQYDRAAYQALATKHIAYLDYMSALVVYAAKRAEGLAKGLPLEDAIFAAEQTVRNAHGSSGMMDLPAISRTSEGWKWFTTFYGYFSHNYQRLRDTGRFARDMDKTSLADWWQIVSRSMGYLVAPAYVHELFRAPPPQPDESYAWWLTKGIGAQVASGFPGVRDVAHSLIQGKVPDSAGPITEAYKGLTAPLVDIHKYVTKGQEPKDWVSHALQVPGWLTGHLPGATGSRIGRLAAGVTSKTGAGQAQYLWDQAVDAPTSWDVDYWRLLMDGNYHPRKGQH